MNWTELNEIGWMLLISSGRRWTTQFRWENVFFCSWLLLLGTLVQVIIWIHECNMSGQNEKMSRGFTFESNRIESKPEKVSCARHLFVNWTKLISQLGFNDSHSIKCQNKLYSGNRFSFVYLPLISISTFILKHKIYVSHFVRRPLRTFPLL